MRVGSLFTGIGGFDLGFERAGMSVVWQSEVEPFACAVLRKHWPHVRNHGDVRSIRGHAVEPIDVLCGGFPCQDISVAGKGAGIDGERSGLWREYARLIRELRPRWVVAENVPALRTRGYDRVAGDLEAAGYAVWPFLVSAADVGAPHLRKRVWIVAHAEGQRRPSERQWREQELAGARPVGAAEGEAIASLRRGHDGLPARLDGDRIDADASENRPSEALRTVRSGATAEAIQRPTGGPFALSFEAFLRGAVHGRRPCQRCAAARDLSPSRAAAAWPVLRGLWGANEAPGAPHRREYYEQLCREHPDVVRVLSSHPSPPCPQCWQDGSWADGIPAITEIAKNRRPAIAALGNSLVPQIAEAIGRALMNISTSSN